MDKLIDSNLGSKRYIEETTKKVKNIALQRTFDIEGNYSVLLTWSDEVKGVSVSGFNVYKSIDGREWVKLNDVPLQTNQFLDTDAKHTIGQEYYYKITYLADTGESSLDEADTITFDTQYVKVDGMNWRLYNVSLEMMRRFYLVLRHSGEEAIILLRQFVGKKCSSCYDYVSHQARDPGCKECYGTGISNGYKKFETRVFFEPATMTISRELEGFRPAYDFRCWTISYPILSSHDYIIRKRTGERFAVNENNKIIIQGLLIQQILRVYLLNKNHPIYKVEV